MDEAQALPPSLVDSRDHFEECHVRWMPRRSRFVERPGYQEEWSVEQCMFCRFYVPLVGAFIEDWGACTNARSLFDGVVRFEHDGCDAFSVGEWWQNAPKTEDGE